MIFIPLGTFLMMVLLLAAVLSLKYKRSRSMEWYIGNILLFYPGLVIVILLGAIALLILGVTNFFARKPILPIH